MRALLPLLLLAAGCSSSATRPAPRAADAPRSNRLASPLRRVPPASSMESPSATARRDAPVVAPPGRVHPRIHGDVVNPLVALAVGGVAALAIFGVIVWRDRRRPLRSVVITTGLPATAHDADLNCAYCRSTLRGEIVYCAACATPYHADCARQLTACAIYACGSLAFQSGRQTAFVPALRT